MFKVPVVPGFTYAPERGAYVLDLDPRIEVAVVQYFKGPKARFAPLAALAASFNGELFPEWDEDRRAIETAGAALYAALVGVWPTDWSVEAPLPHA